MATPIAERNEIFSPNMMAAKITAKTTLSLSMGATCDTFPSFIAIK